MSVAFRDILKARQRIAGHVRRTPLALSNALTARIGQPVHLKLEHQQATGSFKLRGATNAVASLNEDERRRGVAAASTGNHGRAVAFAAKSVGARAIVCMSSLVPANKRRAVEALGAKVRIVGDSQDDAQEEVDRLVSEEGFVAVPPFDHPAVIAGQGTLGLEILEDLPQLRAILVPLSGGGLIAGIALAAKTVDPSIRIVGVSMERGPAMAESLKAGRPVFVREEASLADSLGGGIGLANRHTFEMARAYVDDCVLLTEHEIAEAVRHAYFEEGEIVEGAAAVGIGAILAGKVTLDGPTAIVLSGKNIDMDLHRRIVAGEAPEP